MNEEKMTHPAKRSIGYPMVWSFQYSCLRMYCIRHVIRMHGRRLENLLCIIFINKIWSVKRSIQLTNGSPDQSDFEEYFFNLELLCL